MSSYTLFFSILCLICLLNINYLPFEICTKSSSLFFQLLLVATFQILVFVPLPWFQLYCRYLYSLCVSIFSYGHRRWRRRFSTKQRTWRNLLVIQSPNEYKLDFCYLVQSAHFVPDRDHLPAIALSCERCLVRVHSSQKRTKICISM